MDEIREYRGFKYCVKLLHTEPFMPSHYCGYVQLKGDDLLSQGNFENGEDDVDVICHGGITFDASFNEGYLPEGRWIGFDCAHAGDTMEECNEDFCDKECRWIIDQLWAWEHDIPDAAGLDFSDDDEEDELCAEIKKLEAQLTELRNLLEAARTRKRYEDYDAEAEEEEEENTNTNNNKGNIRMNNNLIAVIIAVFVGLFATVTNAQEISDALRSEIKAAIAKKDMTTAAKASAALRDYEASRKLRMEREVVEKSAYVFNVYKAAPKVLRMFQYWAKLEGMPQECDEYNLLFTYAPAFIEAVKTGDFDEKPVMDAIKRNHDKEIKRREETRKRYEEHQRNRGKNLR